jgi:hypothetical protein
MAARASRVAELRDVPVFDTIGFLSSRSRDGILGFDEFYDYVHFTPRGALLVGAQLFLALQEAGITAPAPGISVDEYIEHELDRLADSGGDPLEKSEWLGIGFEPVPRPDRNLWKYDRMLEALDARIEANPGDLRALVYRGNARAFTRDGGAEAARDYRAALALDPANPAVLRNLERVLAERPAG